MAEEAVMPSTVEGTSESIETPGGAAVAPPPTRAPGGLGRTIEWFWRGRAIKRLRAEQKQISPHSQELATRARLLFALAERAEHPAEPLPSNADAPAAELYRQSAYYAARALAEQRGSTATRAWDGLYGDALSAACGGAERATELARWVEAGTFTESWDVAKEERAARAAALRGLCRFLLGELAWPVRARDALWLQRALRLGSVLLAVLTVVLFVRVMNDRAERKNDVAVGKPWRTSSSSGLGCTSPAQQCGTSTDFFFHTNEERNPWVEIDLGKPTEISAVRLVNRRDCCYERATPIVIEVGSDPDHFKEVARQPTPFNSWRADFPKTTARYVRARSTAKTMLHLAEVRVLSH